MQLKGKVTGVEDSWAWSVWVGWWPAATRLHVHCPAAGVEVS